MSGTCDKAGSGRLGSELTIVYCEAWPDSGLLLGQVTVMVIIIMAITVMTVMFLFRY